MSGDARKPGFEVSETGLCSHRRWLEAGNFGFRKYGAFVFDKAKIWFSDGTAHFFYLQVQ